MENQLLTIAVSTIFQDAGDATRAIEIAKAVRQYVPRGVKFRMVFLSHGSPFEQKALDCGFEIYHALPKLSGVGMHQDLKPRMAQGEIIGEKALAKELIAGEIEAYKAIKPDLVLHGFWPVAGVARRMMEKEIPAICFLPLPLTDSFMDVIPDVPEQVKALALLPHRLRMKLFRAIPRFIKKRLPMLGQRNIRTAARELGWKGPKLINVFDLLRADLTIVNDLPDYYNQKCFPANVKFSGPVFPRSGLQDELSSEVREVFSVTGKSKIYCTLGSSGTKKQLLEIVQAFTYGVGLEWNAVILAPASVCSLTDARAVLGVRPGVLITNEFVPAQKVNTLADVTICHGGQGTVQTALSCGTPIVAVAMQQEQFINLANISAYGAGIRIPFDQWNAAKIQKATERILSDKKFRESAGRLKERVNNIDGGKNSAQIIWDYIKSEIIS